MIPRYQRVLFWILLGLSVAMAVVLIRLRERAEDRIAGRDAGSESEARRQTEVAPPASPLDTATLLEADDLDGSVAPVTRKIALPREAGARARVLLSQLLADYAAPESKHPLAAGPGVEEVFFMAPARAEDPETERGDPQGETAIVSLARVFAENHPSGIEPETLTLLSIVGTLHENFPEVQRVRFLVDGQPRETLAGHADLTRAYLASESETHP